jgi:quercetin dioxygenase-like cupin family protein
MPSGAPGKKHWHGATSTTSTSPIAIVEKLDGKRTIDGETI